MVKKNEYIEAVKKVGKNTHVTLRLTDAEAKLLEDVKKSSKLNTTQVLAAGLRALADSLNVAPKS